MIILQCPICDYPTECPSMPFDVMACPRCHERVDLNDWTVKVSNFSQCTNRFFWGCLMAIGLVIGKIFRVRFVWDG